MEHFDPLCGWEPHTQLIEATDAGGRRHFLDGRPVPAGAVLELLSAGVWVPVRYEWNAAAGELPHAHLQLGGPAAAQAHGATPTVSFALPSSAVLRWPA